MADEPVEPVEISAERAAMNAAMAAGANVFAPSSFFVSIAESGYAFVKVGEFVYAYDEEGRRWVGQFGGRVGSLGEESGD